MKQVKVDLKDKKILYELDMNARQSAPQIAKKVGLSKDAVNYRISRLRKLGVIKHYYAVFNTLGLGFMHFNTLFKFRNINQKIKSDFIKFCKNHEKVIWCVSCLGAWDFAVSFLAKNLEEYGHFNKEVLNKFGNNIHEKSLSLMIDSPTYTRDYLVGGKLGKEFEYKASKNLKLDKIDYKILSGISQEADKDIVNLSKTLGFTVDVTRNRIKQLMTRGVIQGFRIAIDLEKIGYHYYKLLFSLKDITESRETEFRAYCKKNPNIVYFIKYLGNWEIQIELEVASESELFEIVEEIRNKFGDIIKTYDVLRLNEEKLNYFPMSS